MPEIRPPIDRVTPYLLRRHVRRRPQTGARRTEARVSHLGKTKIEDLHRPARYQHHIARLQVPVHDPRGVRARQPQRDLPRDLERLATGQRPLPVETGLERLSGVQRHRQEQPPVPGLADFVDGTEIRMVERGGRARFLEEARLGTGVQTVERKQELERDGPAEAGVFGAIDHAHASRAERLQHTEVRNRPPCQAEGIGKRRDRREQRGFERSKPLIGLGIGCQQLLDSLAQRGIS